MKKYDYFWETKYPFEQFLAKIFKNNEYQTKCSLTGNGIFYLVKVNNKLYEIKYTSTSKMGIADNHNLDNDKKFIIDTIVNNLTTDNYVVFGGKYITFPVAQWIAKVEIIKKMSMPT